MGWTYRVRRCWCGKAAIDGTYCADHYRKPEESGLPAPDPELQAAMKVAAPQAVMDFLMGRISRQELDRLAGIDPECWCNTLPDGRECTCSMCRNASEEAKPIPF